jgi:hypothetical protein
VQSERRARRLGNCFIVVAMTLMITDIVTDSSFTGMAVLFALAGGTCIGRAAEAKAVRQGTGLSPD